MPTTDNPTYPEATHNPISLAPGIDLMVKAGYENDEVTRDCVARCKEALTRAEHIYAIKRGLDRMLQLGEEERSYVWKMENAEPDDRGEERDVDWCLAALFECTPFIGNREGGVEAGLAARALVALCSVIDDDDVAHLRSQVDNYLEQLEAAS